MKIVLATSNPHKVQEMNDIVKNTDIEFILPPSGFNPEENGTTFEENSYIKAYEAWKISHTWTLADDSGLCIDALNGAPGLYSARYAETPQKRINRVLSELEGIENRSARFKCAMTLINPQGEKVFANTEICEGSIVKSQRGINGFGYDPIFLLEGSTQTMAELSEEEKNKVSHRSKALNSVLKYLAEIQQISIS